MSLIDPDYKARKAADSARWLPLPEWVDPAAWADYVDQRIRDKKAMTARSAKKRLERLYELHAAGYDVNDCIDEAINGHWLDFYPPQDKAIPAASGRSPEAIERERRDREYAEAMRDPEKRAASDEAKRRALAAVTTIRRAG